MLDDVICAVSTALKDGAISIVRMSGDGCLDLISEISDLKNPLPGRIAYGHIYEGEEMIDEVLISSFKAPKSYTREDMIEINCHGGVFSTRRILNLLLKKGCRLAERGEFTRRAYLNGRIDLAQAEAVNDMIQASNLVQAKSALKGLNGSVDALIQPLILSMQDVLSQIEVNIDYPEYEDIEEVTIRKVSVYVEEWLSSMKEMITKAERFRLIKEGLKTVIIGKPNVGKSSLLNALLNEEKAIVTSIPGTTRDVVEGKVSLENITLLLSDTAGIRDSSDPVEQIGISRSYQALEDAELILLVIDPSDFDDEDRKLIDLTEGKNRILVYNKSDLKRGEGICISAKNGDISELSDYLNDLYRDDISLIDEDVLNNERQIALMKKAYEEISILKQDLGSQQMDVVMLNIEEAYHDLCEITGKEYREDLIDHLFANFCLGK